MSTFVISPLNSLTFKKKDGLLPNFNNTLDRFDVFIDAINVKKCQKFLSSETIKTQIRTDYETITAKLYDLSENETVLAVNEVSTYTYYSFYEFEVTGQPDGVYKIIVTGQNDGDPDVLFECEPFELVTGEVVAFQGNGVRLIPGYKKVVYYNNKNTFYIDYSTGIKHFVWIPAITFKLIPVGEIDVYNNLDTKEKLEQTNFRSILFENDQIPRHLAIKFIESSSMDYFAINDTEYIVPEIPEITYYNDSNLVTMSLSIEERFTIGVNSDDQGFETTPGGDPIIIDTDLVMVIGENNLSAGTAQYAVSEGYAVRHLDMRLVSGGAATIKIGTTPGGDEISKEKTLNAPGDKLTIDRSYVLNWDGTGTVHITKTGVGSVVDVWLTTIKFRE